MKIILTLLRKLGIIRKRKRLYMARPREIELEAGTVSLCGFPKELADELEEHVLRFGKNQSIVANQTVIATVDGGVVLDVKPIEIGELTHKALGMYYDEKNKQFKISLVSYNPLSMQAKVESLKDGGDFRNMAINNFKVELDRLRFW